MISIERNEKYKQGSVSINNKVLADLNKQTGQWEYHKHQIQVLSPIVSKEREGKYGKQTTCWFTGTLDNNSEKLTFFFNDSEFKSLTKEDVEQGDTIEVSGGFYMSKKNEFKTCVNIKNLSRKEKEVVVKVPDIVSQWNIHFMGDYKNPDNNLANFVDTVRDDPQYNNISKEEVERWFNELVTKQ